MVFENTSPCIARCQKPGMITLPMKAALSLLFLLFACPGFDFAQRPMADTVNVFFDLNKSGLAGGRLDLIREMIQSRRTGQSKIASIDILGYADSSGTARYNDRLSAERAKYIKSFLQQEWSDSSTVWSTSAYGESMATQASDSLNRRVSVVFTYKMKEAQTMPDTATILVVDTIIQLPNIRFVEDQAYLTNESFSAMPSYIHQLQREPFDSMLIVGYYNHDGKLLARNDPRFILSGKRARLIYDYLVDAGFDRSKISWEGAGNRLMVVPKPRSIDQMRQNIRVEIILYRKP